MNYPIKLKWFLILSVVMTIAASPAFIFMWGLLNAIDGSLHPIKPWLLGSATCGGLGALGLCFFYAETLE